jgi:hypothetical protein
MKVICSSETSVDFWLYWRTLSFSILQDNPPPSPPYWKLYFAVAVSTLTLQLRNDWADQEWVGNKLQAIFALLKYYPRICPWREWRKLRQFKSRDSQCTSRESSLEPPTFFVLYRWANPLRTIFNDVAIVWGYIESKVGIISEIWFARNLEGNGGALYVALLSHLPGGNWGNYEILQVKTLSRVWGYA